MKILLVINNFYMKGNGMAASARRTAQYLKEAGHEVRVLSGPNKNAPARQKCRRITKILPVHSG